MPASENRVVSTTESVCDCPICFEKIVAGETIAKSYLCSHTFHANCLQPWHQSALSCPMCRARKIVIPDIDPEDDRMENLREEWSRQVTDQDTKNSVEVVARIIAAVNARTRRQAR